MGRIRDEKGGAEPVAQPATMATAVEQKAADAPPKVRPPGTVVTKGRHGPQKAIRPKAGLGLLYEVMALSANVAVEQLCHEAALEIQRLRTTKG